MWWNWQTCWTQNPVVATPYRFDPDHRHQQKRNFCLSKVPFLFIHCECDGISSRFSVYLITEGAYHQPQVVSLPQWWYTAYYVADDMQNFILMIYKASPWFVFYTGTKIRWFFFFQKPFGIWWIISYPVNNISLQYEKKCGILSSPEFGFMREGAEQQAAAPRLNIFRDLEP